MSVTVSVSVESDDGLHSSIDGVLVRVLAPTYDFVTEGLTGSYGHGVVHFSLVGDAVDGVEYLLNLTKDGYSFPPSPERAILVYDPTTPDNNLLYQGHVGETASRITISVMNDALTPAPIAGVKVGVFSQADAFLTDGLTGADGLLELYLSGVSSPGTEYIIRTRKDGVSWAGGPTHRIHAVVSAPSIVELVGHVAVPQDSSDPDMCRVYGYLCDVSMSRSRHVRVDFIPKPGFPERKIGGLDFPGAPSVVRSYPLMFPVTKETDDQGYLEVLLPRGGNIEVHVHGLEAPGLARDSILIPEAPSFPLEKLLFPYLESVTVPSSILSMLVGAEQDVAVTALGCNQQQLLSKEDLDAFMAFTSSDITVLSMDTANGGLLRLRALTPGTATIGVTRTPERSAPRRPGIADLSTPLLTVTVS